MSRQRIAIVGAGIAGLSAARRLDDAEVLLVDKARGPGGRISTRRAEGFAFDHGAQYFTCRDAIFSPVVRDWCERGVAGAWEGRFSDLHQGNAVQRPSPGTRYVGVPRMSALSRDLAKGFEVETSERVERIQPSSAGWSLSCESGKRLEGFDAVVVATPAPQTVPLLKSHAAFARRVGTVPMRPCHAAMLAFESPLDVDFDAAFVADSPLAWIARNGSKPERPDGNCWVLHSTPDWSVEHVDDAPEAVAAALLDALAKATGASLPPTVFQAAHRWLLARTDQPLREPYLWDAQARIGVCGDWLHGDRIEDAFLSGRALGEAIRQAG